jgi:hypothetical protein
LERQLQLLRRCPVLSRHPLIGEEQSRRQALLVHRNTNQMMKAVPTAGSGKHMEMAMLIIGMLSVAVGVIVKLAVVCRIDRIMGWVMLPLDKLLGATQGRDAEI